MVSHHESAQAEVTRRRALSAIVIGAMGSVGTLFALTRSDRGNEAAASQISCDQVHENLQDFVDDKIADRYLRGLISRHLFVCSSCQKAYHGMIDGDDFLCGNDQEA